MLQPSEQVSTNIVPPEDEPRTYRQKPFWSRFGVAVEVNSRPERLDPPKRLLRLAVEAGCSVAIDTDAHAPGQLDWQHLGCERAHLTGVRTEQVVNARDVDALLSWTGRAAAAGG